MTNHKASNKQTYDIGVAFIFFMLLVGTTNVFAVTKDISKGFPTNNNITAGTAQEYNVQLDITNISSVTNSYVDIYTPDGIVNATLYLNGSICQNWNTTIFSPATLGCTTQMTTAIASADANFTIKNQNDTRYLMVSGLVVHVIYEEAQPTVVDGSILLKASDYQANVTQQAFNLSNVNTTLNNAIASTNTTAFNAIVSTNTTAYNAIQSTNTTAYNAIVSNNQTLTTYYNDLVTRITNVPTNVWTAVSRTLTEIRQSIIRAT